MVHPATEDEWIRAGIVGIVATVLVTTLMAALLVGSALVLNLSL